MVTYDVELADAATAHRHGGARPRSLGLRLGGT
jgi:hypothetical protein